MGLNRSIADDLRAQREPVPDEVWEYADPKDITVRTLRPKWTWIQRVCHEIPIGKCVMIPVPPEYKGRLMVFMDNMRCSLGHGQTLMDKFTVRRSRHEDYVVVMKSGVWAKLYRDMESQEA